MNSQYRNNPYVRNQGGQNINPNRPDESSKADAIKKLPYGFIPVIDTFDKNQAIELDSNDSQFLTGKIKCRMFAMNELCVGNSHGEDNGESTIYPLKVGGTTVIPANTLKGCVANFLAAYLGLPISRLNNRRYSFRPNNAFARDAKLLNGAGIISELCEDGSIKVDKFYDNKFAFTRNEQQTQQAAQYQYNDTEYQRPRERQGQKHLNKYVIPPSRNADENKTGWFYFYTYHDGIDGEGNFGSQAQPQVSHKAFGVKVTGPGKTPDLNGQLTIPKDTVDFYYDVTIKQLSDDDVGHLKDHPMEIKKQTVKTNIKEKMKLSKGDVIFFEYQTGTKTILTFGKHFRYRWAFKNCLHNFAKDYLEYNKNALNKGELNIIEEMFGFSYEDSDIEYAKRSKSGKVHFSYAVHKPGTGKVKAEKWLPRPGSPHPSSYEIYLKENYTNPNSPDPMVTYGDPARKDFHTQPRLSGRKFYYATAATPYNDSKTQDSVTKTVLLKDVLYPDKGCLPEFEFTVNFENLRPEELQLLRFALCLGTNQTPDPQKELYSQGILCHQIGYGKNYGMGAVKILIDKDNDKEAIYKYYENESEELIEELITVENLTLDIKVKHLFELHKDPRQYPISQEAKDKAIAGHTRKNEPDNDSDSVGIYSWHTSVKNKDLEKRRKSGVQK